MNPDTSLACEIRRSPNHNARRVERPDILLLHYTGMGTAEGALRWLCAEESQVSCHYLVHEDGRVVQMVPESARAWHAGVGCWKGHEDVNSRSVGIEIVNPGHDGDLPPFADAQIEAVIRLGLDIVARLAIPAERVLAHSDVAPARKQDPGERFPWGRLHAAGLGHWVEPLPLRGGRYLSAGDQGDPVRAYQQLLAAYGYDVTDTAIFDEATRLATIAFQRHFRQSQVDGVADVSTVGTLHRLLTGLPQSPFTV